jgi:hypothetical protein
MLGLNQEVEKEIEVGMGVKSRAKTSPTPPKEGLSAVEDNNPEKTCRHGKPGYINANHIPGSAPILGTYLQDISPLL